MPTVVSLKAYIAQLKLFTNVEEVSIRFQFQTDIHAEVELNRWRPYEQNLN